MTAAPPLDGAALLDDLAAAFRRHLVLPPGGAAALALWVLFSHTHDAHRHSPRLAVLSPTMRCGKTTLMGMLKQLVANPAAGRFSSAVIYRLISKFRKAGKVVTLLLDEADTYIEGNEEFRGIINQGWERENASTWRCDGEGYDPTDHSTWAPVAIAKIGTLSDTIIDRSIVVSLKRKLPTEHVAPLDKVARTNLVSLAQRAAQWAQQNFAALEDAAPAMPSSLAHNDRAQDNWRPLLAIADLCDDPWPQTARMGASLLLGSDEDPSLGVRLLSDIRDVFARCGADRLTSEMLCSKLIALEDRPWGECHKGGAITQTRLAAMLEPYGVKPNSVRFPAIGGTRKGYLLDWFNDPFARYLPPYPPQAGTPEQTNDCRGLEAA